MFMIEQWVSKELVIIIIPQLKDVGNMGSVWFKDGIIFNAYQNKGNTSSA